MLLALPFEALFILYRLRSAGYDAYLVGGAIRDLMLKSLGHQPQVPHSVVTDYDCTTNATPEQIQALFPENFYENVYGTVSITHEAILSLLKQAGHTIPTSTLATQSTPQLSSSPKIIDVAKATKLHDSLSQQASLSPTTESARPVHPFEITTYRSDGTYQDHRRPTSVSWGASIQDDLSRRDFTINAIALQIHDEYLNNLFAQPTALPTELVLKPTEYVVIDPFQGVVDLVRQTLKTVGDPSGRFHEDALRMLRAIRLSVQLGCVIDESTFTAIREQVELLAHVSGERIRDEFLKMLQSPAPRRAIELLDETGALTYVLPDLLRAKGVRQGGHHTSDVWTHSLDALAACPTTDPIVRLATLLHDVGKPATFRNVEGNITFYNHEIVGARMIRPIATHLKLSKPQAIKLYTLVRHHMFHYQPHNTDAAIRRFMRKVGLDYIDDILDLREGDRLGSGAKKTSWRLEEMKQRMIEQLHQPMDLRDLAINGHDLMTTFNLKPGPQLGTILHNLFERVLDNPELNTKEKLLEIAQTLLTTNPD